MKDRLDGWTIKWLKEKIIDTETKLGKIKKHKIISYYNSLKDD